MYAVIETGGKQYRVTEGDVINVEKLDAEVGKTLTIKEVLILEKDDETVVGAPYVTGASVKAEVVEIGKAKKVVIYKYKAKKDSKKKQGHRQPYTQLKIKSIAVRASKKKADEPAEAAE
ncbi:MAG: 50S ribosomal protein L21 [Firmicutes bacterium]|nr:50S ribosomal protein L21 [Bacillota bacterium]